MDALYFRANSEHDHGCQKPLPSPPAQNRRIKGFTVSSSPCRKDLVLARKTKP